MLTAVREGSLTAMARSWVEMDGRILGARLKGRDFDFTVLTCYAPVDGPAHLQALRRQFWAALDVALTGVPVRSDPLILGDLNARLGSIPVQGVVGCFGAERETETGICVHLFADNDISVFSTRHKK